MSIEAPSSLVNEQGFLVVPVSPNLLQQDLAIAQAERDRRAELDQAIALYYDQIDQQRYDSARVPAAEATPEPELEAVPEAKLADPLVFHNGAFIRESEKSQLSMAEEAPDARERTSKHRLEDVQDELFGRDEPKLAEVVPLTLGLKFKKGVAAAVLTAVALTGGVASTKKSDSESIIDGLSNVHVATVSYNVNTQPDIVKPVPPPHTAVKELLKKDASLALPTETEIQELAKLSANPPVEVAPAMPAVEQAPTAETFKFPLKIFKEDFEKARAGGRWDPNSKDGRHHDYVASDIPAPVGTEVVAAQNGTIINATEQACIGNKNAPNVTIRTDQGTVQFYAHLKSGTVGPTGLKKGDHVTAGQRLGEVGPVECGAAYPHLHFQESTHQVTNTDNLAQRRWNLNPMPKLREGYNKLLSKIAPQPVPAPVSQPAPAEMPVPSEPRIQTVAPAEIALTAEHRQLPAPKVAPLPSLDTLTERQKMDMSYEKLAEVIPDKRILDAVWKAGEMRGTTPELVGAILVAEQMGEVKDLNTLPERFNGVAQRLKTGWKTSYAAAKGPFQFLQSTFNRYKVDANGGGANIQDFDDAAASAANYLEANGGHIGNSEAQIRNAIWHYNHSQKYVNAVMRTFNHLMEKSQSWRNNYAAEQAAKLKQEQEIRIIQERQKILYDLAR